MNDKPEVQLKPSSYQPSKKEIEEFVKLDGTPEDMRSAVMRNVNVVEDPET